MAHRADMRIPRRGQIGGLRVLWWHSEALVEAWKEALQHTVSVIDGDRARESQLGNEPVLEGACHTLNPPQAKGLIERISAVSQARPSRD